MQLYKHRELSSHSTMTGEPLHYLFENNRWLRIDFDCNDSSAEKISIWAIERLPEQQISTALSSLNKTDALSTE
jgi:hypothetical protein